ncbi:hypothetical protein [Adhaeribacter radiodurans]|uniref:DUF4386 family protein n=1 Tax=Adhaeribacter radiodurans TaxID=2745197 RepID=A0A7L7L1U0_9BACT|nr:hypothetical protein [Adhaeribacter radiodurans]QMU26757.1 hypothetical protein HUW48_01325 [Adhaeribacter radiodurans]
MSTVITASETISRPQPTVIHAKPTTLLDRIGMASGLAFVALFMYVGFLTPGPPADFTNETLAAFYKQNVANHLVGTHLASVAFLLFFIFSTTLHNLVRQQVKSNNWLPGVLLGSALMTTVIFIMGQASLAATSLMASRDVNADLVRGLDEISHITTHFFTAPLSLFLITTGVCIWLYRIMPRWIAVLNLIAGLTLVVTTGTFDHRELLHKIGVLALLVFLLSTLIMSIALLWKSRKANKSL